ncbi:MAG TPA: agmatinase, partial [Thermoanaerobaculia bacterium]
MDNQSTTPQTLAFAGASTFARLPAMNPGDTAIDLAILGVPFDGLVTFRPGARFGPGAIRQSSVLCRNYSRSMEVAVYERLHSVDAGDAPVNPFDYEETFRSIEAAVGALQERGAAVISLGGDHSILLPILRATHRRHGSVTLIHFDAHNDTSDGPEGQKMHHGTIIRRAIEEGIVEGNRIFQIGLRGTIGSAEDDEYGVRAGIRRLDMSGFHDAARRAAFTETLRATAGLGPCYLTFDVDAIDPAFAPGTGTPVPGGLTSFEALDMMASLRGLRIIGGDVVEVAPAYDSSNITALLGASIASEIA